MSLFEHFTPRSVAVALLPLGLLANCGLFAPPPPQGLAASDPVETMRLHDGRMSYATQSAAPPPGFAEVAEFRTRELCTARGASGARMVAAPGGTTLQFECID